jgi:dihydroflavonol-4-reductase
LNLVTGATGIIGSHVVLKLMQNNQPVIACKTKKSDTGKMKRLFSYYGAQTLFDKISWREMDVCDVFSIEEALEGINTVYHCAGYVSFNKKDRKKLFSINEGGTANMVTACLQKKIENLCHVSSIITINNSDYKSALTEDVFWKRNGRESDYALSKYNAEREVWRGMEEGLNALIVNPGVVLSPGFWNQSSSQLFARCYQGNAFYTSGKTGYISAKDAAAAMIALVEKRQFANRYILVEDNYTTKHILDTICKGFSKPGPGINAGYAMMQFARFLDFTRSLFSGKDQVLTKDLINSALNQQEYSNAKLKRTINIDLTPVDREIIDICGHYTREKAHLGL